MMIAIISMTVSMMRYYELWIMNYELWTMNYEHDDVYDDVDENIYLFSSITDIWHHLICSYYKLCTF